MKQNTSVKADTATHLSELLLLRSAIGDGIASPFPATPYMVFSSSTPGESHDNLKAAERDFLVWHDLQQKADQDEVKMLEMQIEANPSRAASLKESLKAVKEKLALVPYPTWRDTDSHKSTIIDLLKRSAYNALSFVDEHAARLTVDLCSPVLTSRYFGWVSLTGSTSDATLIRSSATGGATIHSLAGDSLPKFNHFSSAHPGSIDKLLTNTMKAGCAAGVLGKCVVIPGKAGAGPRFAKDTILSVLKHVFSKGNTSGRLPVTFASPELKADWDNFLRLTVASYHTGATQSYEKALDFMPASLATIGGAATQAVLVEATIRAVQKAELDKVRPTEVPLIPADLDLAIEFATWLFNATSGFDRLDAKGANREKALATFATPEKVCAAEQSLYDAITLSPDRKISHKAAIRTPGVTAGLLELLVARDHRFAELKGTENIGMGKTTRAYMLKADVTIDPEEAVVELEEAQAEWDTYGVESGVDTVTVQREFKTLQDVATKRRYKADGSICYAAIPITEMTPQQIRLVPAIEFMFPDEVCLRGTWEEPEPDFLTEADEDDPAAFTKGIPNLWFRYNSKLEEQHNWTMAWKLGFAEAWGKPLGQIDTEN